MLPLIIWILLKLVRNYFPIPNPSVGTIGNILFPPQPSRLSRYYRRKLLLSLEFLQLLIMTRRICLPAIRRLIRLMRRKFSSWGWIFIIANRIKVSWTSSLWSFTLIPGNYYITIANTTTITIFNGDDITNFTLQWCSRQGRGDIYAFNFSTSSAWHLRTSCCCAIYFSCLDLFSLLSGSDSHSPLILNVCQSDL